MPRARPHQPRAVAAHPLFRGHVGLWPLVRRADDLAGRGAAGTLVGAGASWGPSAEGPGLDLNGTAGYADCGTASGVGGAGSMTVWVRMILRTAKANATYGGVVSQWNDIASAFARQQFSLAQYNNLFGRPANCLDFVINTLGVSPGSYANASVAFQAGDVGRPWTVVGTYDGATVRLHAFLPSGYVTASAAKTGLLNVTAQSATFLGNQDSQYGDMVLLGVGVVRNRAWNAQEAARFHAAPYALFRPPSGAILAALPGVRVTQVVRETLVTPVTSPRVTQVVRETLATTVLGVRVTQAQRTVLQSSAEVPDVTFLPAWAARSTQIVGVV